ncbi:MAG TPA: SDR family oxidoreductase [Candidatus Acidoferrum sp.]|nr:SDR family oxidoreductase [Candidatus Acidoferrum sp.]
MNERGQGLKGKVAIVTGAGRGIGRAIAIAYAQAGVAVCCAARTLEEIEGTEKEIVTGGGQAIAVHMDVTQLDSVEQMFRRTVQHFGGLDILVINAGVLHERKPVADSRPEAWRATVEVNLIGAYYCAKTAIPYMRQRGAGKIITVGSGVGHRGRAGSSAYACSKAGLWMLTRVLAQELWPDNISVNELVPGPVKTVLNVDASSQRGSSLAESEWLKTPEDVVPLAMFLATQPAVGPTAQSFSLMRRDT